MNIAKETARLVAATLGADYCRDYRRGQETSRRVGNLDAADRDGRSWNNAWMDGYLDYAAGREMWHLALERVEARKAEQA